MESHEIQVRSLIGKILAWALSGIVSLICLLVGFVLSRTTPVLGDMFKELGVELPLATKFLIANCSWLYPLFFGGLAVLSIAKELWVHATRRRLSASGIILMAAFSSVGLERLIMYLPMFDLVQKLNQAK
jgi:hypothetical protein